MSRLKCQLIRWLPIAAVCALGIAPFLWLGTPSGHDFEFHLFSWMDARAEWQEGIAYPQWTPSPHWGYGEPRFVFYPPVSWMLGAALGSLLPWKVVPGVYCWLALTMAGTAMYRLAELWLPPSDALFASVLYALNPYHLMIIYWRSAYAELLCAALLPLLLLIVMRLNEPSLRPALWLSLLLAGAWLTNVPAAIMIHYSAAGLVLVVAARENSLRPLRRLALALLLGAGLASLYLIPAIYEERWVNIAEVLSPGVRPQDNFLFTMNQNPDHNRFNLLISLVATSEIAALAVAIYLSRRKRSINKLWLPLATWGAAAAFAMLSFSDVLWEYLPKFRYVQLPFRWLLCLNIALALLLAMENLGSGFVAWMTRAAVWAGLIAVVLFGGQHTQPPWWNTSADIADMQQSAADGSGNEGVDEYVPAGVDPYELNRSLPRLSDQTGTPLERAKILQWTATEKRFAVVAAHPGTLTVRLFKYPAWKAFVNGHEVATGTTEVTGLMMVPVAAGENDVLIRFTRTRDRTLGDAASFASVILLAAAWIGTRRPLLSPGASA